VEVRYVIGRIDDTTQVLVDHLRVHDSFPNYLKTKLNWSKNVGDERDEPWQIVMGSMDTMYCVLVSMAVCLEMNMRANASAGNSPYVFLFSDDVAVPSGGLKAKSTAQTIFGQKVFKMEQFCNAADSGSLLGSHSIRKYAATHARKCGCNKDEKDIRGRWKSKGRVSDVYDDVEKLCIGGACFYLFPNKDVNVNGGVVDATIRNNIEMLKTFLLIQVVPNIRRRVPESCALVLGKAFLWFIYCDDAVSENVLPKEFKRRIKLELKEKLAASDGVDVEIENFNPICRVPVIVSGDQQGSVFIDCIEEQQGQGGGAVVGGMVAGGTPPTGGMNAQLMAVHSLATQLRRKVHEIMLEQVADRAAMQRCFGIVNTGSLRRIGMATAFRVVQGGIGTGNDDNSILAAAGLQNLARAANASLRSPCPCNLYDLWKQLVWEGGSPHLSFHTANVENQKTAIFWRNVVWKMVKHLVDVGITSDMAIDRVYVVAIRCSNKCNENHQCYH
jgi:hypothetical protein